MLNIHKIKKAHTQQQDSTDCGTAALLTLIRYYGGDTTISELRKISGTTVQGTTLLGLYQASEKTGLTAKGYNCNIEDLIEYNKPAILHLTIDNMQHYVVCFGFEQNRFVISDPAKGIRYDTIESLKNDWISGNCLAIEPNSDFKLKRNITAQKKSWLWGILREDRAILIASIVLGVCISVLGMVMAVFSQKLIDDILPNKELSKLFAGIVFVLVLLITRVVLEAMRLRLLLIQGKDFNNRIIDFFYSKLLYMPMSFFDNRKKGDMIARLNDTKRIQNAIVSIVGSSAIDVIVIVVCIVALLFYSETIALMVFVSSVCLFFIVFKKNTPIMDGHREVMKGYAATESNFISTIIGISVIKSFNKQPIFEKINKVLYSFFQNKIFELGELKIKIGVSAGVFTVIISILVVSICSYDVVNDRMTIGEFMATMTITNSILPSVLNIAQLIIPINEAKIAFNRMFEITTNSATKHSIKNESKINPMDIHELTISDLSFRFPGSKPLFSNINMKFEKGKIGAIIGECGCGKSTLISIIQRFYECEKGEIKVNNKNIESIESVQWMNVIATVPQDVYVFNGTIIDNILIGEDSANDVDVVNFCNNLGFGQFINQLPQSYYTIVGEEGVNLSGGQKQLVALARALYKQTPIIILDEPTSSMDSDMEQFVFNLFRKIKYNRIVLCVSHKLDFVRYFSDCIYVIEKKTISAQGDHSKVLESPNFYTKYWAKLTS